MGLDLVARVNAATHYDDFEAANGTALAGRAMPRGGLVWTVELAAAATTSVAIQDGAVRATGGTGNALVKCSPGTLNFDIVARLGTKAANAVPSIAFRAISVLQHYQLALRSSVTVNEYAIFRRNSDGTGTNIIGSGVTPAPGDRIQIRLRGNACTVFVNGTQIIATTLTSYAGNDGVGLNLNGADVTTAFADFNYYGRA